MRFWLKQVASSYFRQKWFLFVFVTVFFCVGIFFGATAAKTLSADQSDQLSVYFNSFLEKVSTTPVNEYVNFRQNVLSNFYIMIAMYILGLTVIGMPLVLVAVFTRGFILGFTVGFLVREKAVRGLIFAIISVLPHNILVIPAVILGGVAALSFSVLLLKRRFTTPNYGIAGQLGLYTAVMLALCLAISAAGLVETYITPVVVKTTATYIR